MFLLAQVSYLFLTTCKVVVFSRAGQSRSVEDTNALISAECLCHPMFCSAPARMWLALLPTGTLCHGLEQCLPKAGARAPFRKQSPCARARGGQLLQVCHGKGTWVSLWMSLWTLLPPSLGGSACAAARHNPLGTSEAPVGAFGDSRLSFHG